MRALEGIICAAGFPNIVALQASRRIVCTQGSMLRSQRIGSGTGACGSLHRPLLFPRLCVCVWFPKGSALPGGRQKATRETHSRVLFSPGLQEVTDGHLGHIQGWACLYHCTHQLRLERPWSYTLLLLGRTARRRRGGA
jgi:hypothetical protein